MKALFNLKLSRIVVRSRRLLLSHKRIQTKESQQWQGYLSQVTGSFETYTFNIVRNRM